MIGGEFEIDLSLQLEGFVAQPNTYYYASGRTALYQIVKSVECKRRKLWLPSWLCRSMIDGVRMAGVECVFYDLDVQFKATVESLDRAGFGDGDAVLIVNYFGLQRLTETARAIKETYPNSILIEDDAQAYWELAEHENSFADYRFTSLRKALAVPDGGLVFTKRAMTEATNTNTFAPLKIRAGEMKRNRGKDDIKDEVYLALFKQGEALIPENYESEMSDDSKRLFVGADLHRAKMQRQANAKHLLRGLAEIGIKPLFDAPEDSVPLFVPIYLKNRDQVRRRMFEHEIYCPVHWPLEGIPVKLGAEMAKHELSLICDQRYGQGEMDQLLDCLE